MDRKDVKEVFAAVKALTTVADRAKAGTRAKELDEVVDTLLGLVGPIPQDWVHGLLDISSDDVRELTTIGVLTKESGGYAPRRLGDVQRLTALLRDRRDYVERIRWWLDDREVLIAVSKAEEFAPESHLTGLRGGRRRNFERWLVELPRLKPGQVDGYRITGSTQRLCVVRVEEQEVVVSFPDKGEPTALMSWKQIEKYDFVHRLARKDKSWSRRREPNPNSSGELRGWSADLEKVALRVAALV
ncbi:hypothetical protein ACFFSW_34060 [Saccharothrix longispora]|uniref:Uncharacterized protein n=1 Tax=Saccharothrix longispora TaxID=33920 RepID=A0ABU1Q420_9PSEU|nr:hypothetical protein [Saccharothrix longispora]MDR6597174.1 hypothetical protein [Saccharothrix longispora]